MIESLEDYRRFLRADREALGGPRGIKQWLLHDIWRFQRALRRLEYLQNTRPRSPQRAIAWLWWRRQGRRLGFSIPTNVFGEGLSIAHYGTIVVNGGARIGAHCRIHASVNIGTQPGVKGAPRVGAHAYIGPGAVLFGPIELGDHVSVGANSVVTRSFPEGNCVLIGAPARARPVTRAE